MLNIDLIKLLHIYVYPRKTSVCDHGRRNQNPHFFPNRTEKRKCLYLVRNNSNICISFRYLRKIIQERDKR